jgi:nitrous oxidase accessory protein
MVASALFLIAAFLPLWELELVAPQYPKGLFITAYGYDMTGDVDEINELNHYVGLTPLKPENVFELKLFPFGVAGILAVIVLGAYRSRSRKLRIASAAAAWSLPLFMLVDLQYWLYRQGHDIDPDAALTLDPFTPRVLGPTRVLNFHSVGTVSIGFWLFVAAALVLTAGPWFVRFIKESWSNTGNTAGGAVALVLLAFVSVTSFTRPAEASAAGSIADAISRAAPGDTVRIGPGTYREQLVIDKRVTLVGDGWPVIDGDRKGDVVVIAVEGVTLRGFVIQRSGTEVTAEPAGIRVKAGNATLDSNRIHDVLYGIVLEEADGHTVINNSIESVPGLSQDRQGNAIYLHNSNHNRLERNTVSHAKDGLLLLFSDHNLIRGNHVTRVRYGIHFMYASHNEMIDNTFVDNVNGGVLMYSTGARFAGNEFAHNRSIASGYGLMFKDVDDVTIEGNLIHHNRVGIALEGSPFTPGSFVMISENLVGYNQTAVAMFTTTDVTFTGNTFVGNLRQVDAVAGSVEHKNRWSLDGRGNYWDDYEGYDSAGDGIGDLMYRYQGAYDTLVEGNPGLRAYEYTPARMALDLAAKWFPVYRPEPRAVDPYPLMSPTMTLASHGGGGERFVNAAMMAGLVALPAGLFWLASGNSRKRWATC